MSTINMTRRMPPTAAPTAIPMMAPVERPEDETQLLVRESEIEAAVAVYVGPADVTVAQLGGTRH